MKKGVAEGKNCRPLGEITNLVTIKQDAEHETPSPKKRRIDIDAADVGNELAAVEYVDGLYMFYKLAEVQVSSSLSVHFYPFFYACRCEWS